MPIMFWCTDDDRMECLFNFNADNLASFVSEVWRKVMGGYLFNLVCHLCYYSGLWSTFINTVFMFFWHLVCLSVCGVLQVHFCRPLHYA